MYLLVKYFGTSGKIELKFRAESVSKLEAREFAHHICKEQKFPLFNGYRICIHREYTARLRTIQR